MRNLLVQMASIMSLSKKMEHYWCEIKKEINDFYDGNICLESINSSYIHHSDSKNRYYFTASRF
jgi:hypothetical protein